MTGGAVAAAYGPTLRASAKVLFPGLGRALALQLTMLYLLARDRRQGHDGFSPETTRRLDRGDVAPGLLARAAGWCAITALTLLLSAYTHAVAAVHWLRGGGGGGGGGMGMGERCAELVGFAGAAGLPVGGLALLQVVYELMACECAACTSVVVRDAATGCPVHLRTMDWEFDDFGFGKAVARQLDLAALAFEVEFARGGRVVCVGTTWAGFLGLYTGMRCGAFSVSINYRAEGTLLQNVRAALSCRAWGLGALVRDVLLAGPGVGGGRYDARRLYDAAVWRLRHARLVAPCYIVVAGAAPGQGALITRARDGELRPVRLPREPGQPPGAGDAAGGAAGAGAGAGDVEEVEDVIQMNTDWWDVNPLVDLLESAARKDKARQLLAEARVGPLAARWAFLGTPPIFNEITVYGCVMVPAGAGAAGGTEDDGEGERDAGGFYQSKAAVRTKKRKVRK